jgi:arylsulfatase A-like enzyme
LVLAACAAPPARPNVLVIITDDQGYGDLGVHGNPRLRTPNLDALARSAVALDRFFVMPVCSPTRACLLTGRYNYRTGVVDTFIGRSMMHPDETTLAEMLGAAGYRTAIFGKWHLGDNVPLRAIDQGFQEALVLKGGGIGQPSDPPGGDRYFDPTLLRNGVPVKTRGYVSDVLTDAAIRYVSEPRGAPFFVWLAFNAPHDPLEVPDAALAPYANAGLPDATARVYAMVSNIDENVGRLLRALDERGLARDTIVVFLTDNGPAHDRYNAGMRGRKGTVFDGGIRVPCYVRWPARLAAGRRVDRITAHIDLAPTILEACGVAPPAGTAFDGVSLLPLLEGRARDWPDRTLFFQWHRGDEPQPGRACAARSQRWKLVRQEPNAAPMLFDMESDPAESRDVAAAHPEVVASMNRAYEAWFRDVGATRGYAPPRIRVGDPRENPVVLTRQDWRGPRAGWGPKSVGFWEIEAATAGSYEILLRYGASATAVRLTVGATTAEQPVAPTDRACVVRLSLPAGPARLEPTIVVGGETLGVQYAEVRRLQ